MYTTKILWKILDFFSLSFPGQTHHDKRDFLGSLNAKGLRWLKHASYTWLLMTPVLLLQHLALLCHPVWCLWRPCFFFLDLSSPNIFAHEISYSYMGFRKQSCAQRLRLMTLNSNVLVTSLVFSENISDQKQWKPGRVNFDSYHEGTVHHGGHSMNAGAWASGFFCFWTQWAERDKC